MDKPAQSVPIRGHARNKSSTVATRPRSSTKGPLDMEDKNVPVSVATQQPERAAAAASSPASMSMLSPSNRRQSRSPALSPGLRSPLPHLPATRSAMGGATTAEAPRPKDFSFLLKPAIYHPLSMASLPPPFRSSPQQPAPDTPLADLLTAGQFRAAAIVAAQQLTGLGGGSEDEKERAIDPTDHGRIFGLLYTRLACLVLIDAMPLAAQEGRALEDLNSSFYYDAATGEHLVPWELRVLNVRLQALGFGDPRRAIMSYYDLARESRRRAAAALARHDHSASELWKGRLAELGLKVAGALIEMDDMAGAAAHLTSMAGGGGRDGPETGIGRDDETEAGLITTRGRHPVPNRRLEAARALLWLHIGDVEAARAEMHRVASVAAADPSADDNDLGPRIVSALCDMADDDYASALVTWRDLHRDAPADEMIGVNLAVCLLYVGQMQEGRAVLESLVDAGYSSHTLLFNLSTMYELCSDRSKSLKQQLAQRMADRTPSTDGWERVNADFKL
ncbi:hypothetical protein CMQ_7048 [Grosmannia clavigera kw1407]|uniref:Tetratricopeptide repeat protein 15 n=1 Tax=Grosmannia clavigera (strain kw1407 / UAMH 11150) TaxID=655863 RepID=F0XPD1_GROCL|nr:uncharacterized protein CMQ_7048 [Grosmannia clavigera kw1407]EFX00046.1 hypothetical protein CMQ_7048 [Grosmannia clavigera kw1407]